MQVTHLSHLQFPADPATSQDTPATAKGRARQADAAQALPPQASATAQERAHHQQASTIVQLHSAAGAQAPLVYAPPRPSVAVRDDAADLPAMALDHARARERQNHTFTPISVGSDGVLVAARQHSSATANQPEFVTLAVSAMRDFADAAELNKKHADLRPTSTMATASANASTPADTSPMLHGLQKLAARLNVFA